MAAAKPPTIPLDSARKETEFIGSIDVGTTSCRFYIFDRFANVIASHQLEFQQLHPHPGWHEHDPNVYVETVNTCIVEAMAEFERLEYDPDMLKGVGITNQRETTILWDSKTGKPIYNAVAWPDARNTAKVRELREKAKEISFDTPDGPLEGEKGVQAITGLPFSTYFSAAKYAWLLEQVPEVRAAKEAGTLMIGTVECWLLYNYTGGVDGGLYVTDYTNASRTLALSLHTLDWNDQLLEFFNIPRECLPKLVSNSEVYGKFHKGHPLEGVPIASLVGDQQAALVGNKCLNRGDAKQTYGTGCFMLYNTGDDIVQSSHGLLTTVGYRAGPDSPATYALEGSVAVGGSSVHWLRDNLEIIKEAKEVGALADTVKDTGGVYFVTGFSGLFAPYWDMRATGMMIGLSSYTTKAHIARATLEATCFQTRAILEAMAKDTRRNHVESGDGDGPAGLHVLSVDGGMTGSDTLLKIQADILGIPIERPTMRESTALGAAILAGSALKLFGWDMSKSESLEEVNKQGVEVFEPSLTEEEREWKFAGWNRAVIRCMGWKTDSGDG
ncbi:glycerol kinase [Pseudohyphozyma bogoriensis]|nr:glycerol kinase [Pseudohyphozyma bogoriensis]